jgi:ATP-dependent DNA helicase PIF1
MVELSIGQKQAFDAYKEGKNAFITGPGGVGKSFIIREIQKDAERRGKSLQVCAMTGCAAILLQCGAKTLHSWAGIGLANGSIDEIIDRINKYNKVYTWLRTDILIVDEVSMLSMRLFNMLNTIGKNIRKNDKPFGGIQLIFSGDFYQLPPVPERNVEGSSKFCFESDEWANTFTTHIELKTNFRQNNGDFVDILNQIRIGQLDDKAHQVLQSRVGETTDSAVQPVKLFPRKHSVDRINRDNIQAIKEPIKTFTASVMNEADADIPQKKLNDEEAYLRKNALFDEKVRIKKRSQVMCIANVDLDLGVCNGSVGVVEDYSYDGYPIVKFNNGVKRTMEPHLWSSETIRGFGIMQVPLILAWAVTIHKVQGATLDMLEIDIGKNIFEYGQTYVGLSRVKTIDGLFIKSFAPEKIKVNAKVKKFYDSMND